MNERQGHSVRMAKLEDSVTIKMNTLPSTAPSNSTNQTLMQRLLRRRSSHDGIKNLIHEDELIKAIEENDVEACKNHLEASQNFSSMNKNYSLHPLLLAVQKENLDIVRLLIDKMHNINVTDKRKSTALHFAANQKHVECCHLLLEKGISCNTKDRDGNEPIHLAASEGLFSVVQDLLKRNCNPYDLNKEHLTPVHLAAMHGHFEVLKALINNRLLIDNMDNINVTDVSNSSALHFAANEGHIESCHLLLEKGISCNTKDRDGNEPLHLAVSEGLLLVVKDLLKRNANPNDLNKRHLTPVHLGAMHGHFEVLKVLINNPSTPGNLKLKDRYGNFPLHHAAYCGHVQCCNLIVEKMSTEDINAKSNTGETPLIAASKNGQARCCEILQKAEVNEADNKGLTSLHYAAKKGYINTVSILLKMNPDIGIQTPNNENAIEIACSFNSESHQNCMKIMLQYIKESPLTTLKSVTEKLLAIAASNNCKDTLSYLLATGDFSEEVNVQNSEGKTLLHLALENEYIDICNILLNDYNPNCLLKDKDGNLPLHIAASKGLYKMCKELLKSSKSVNAINEKNNEGATPLHCASTSGFSNCCKLFFHQKADVKVYDKNGFTPFHCAARSGKVEVLQIFLEERKCKNINERVENSTDTALHLATRYGQIRAVEYIFGKGKIESLLVKNKKKFTYLEEAFSSGDDSVFNFFLSKWPSLEDSYLAEENTVNFKALLHSYMHMAIKKERRFVIDGIIESSWWYAGFNNEYCDKNRCQNSRNLVKTYPESAEKLFNNCIQVNESSVINDFKIFEDSFYTCAGDNDYPLITKSAFDENGKLKTNYQVFSGATPHLLSVALDKNRFNLLEHPLTDAYFKYKWDNYLSKTIYLLTAYEILIFTLTAIFMCQVWNLDQVSEKYNTSEILFDSSFGNCSHLIIQDIDSGGNLELTLLSIRIAMFILTLGFSAIEMYGNYKLGRRPIIIYILKIIRHIGPLIIIIPSIHCSYSLSILVIQTYQWQIGIVTLMLIWLHIVQSLNEIPMLSTFMPITPKFMKSFLKAFMFIVIILFIFVLVFFLLFHHNNLAFKNIWISFVKSTVWLLGDLGYDASFLNEDSVVLYPIMSNIIFLIFVTTITGFVVNLIVSQPTGHLDAFRNESTRYEAASKIELMLKYDTIYASIYPKHVISTLKIEYNAARPKNNYFWPNVLFAKEMVSESKPTIEELLKELIKQQKLELVTK